MTLWRAYPVSWLIGAAVVTFDVGYALGRFLA
jgi:hypothetical protein